MSFVKEKLDACNHFKLYGSTWISCVLQGPVHVNRIQNPNDMQRKAVYSEECALI